MQTKNILLILITCCFCIQVIAQNNTVAIKEIQAHYYELKEKMKASSDGEYPNYYVVRIEENVDKILMPGVGNYYGTEELWYLTDEEKGIYGREGALMYRKSEFQISMREQWTEYVFKEGKLVFCYIKIKEGGEYRYYFEEEVLIKYSEKNAAGAFYSKEDWTYLLKYAKQ